MTKPRLLHQSLFWYWLFSKNSNKSQFLHTQDFQWNKSKTLLSITCNIYVSSGFGKSLAVTLQPWKHNIWYLEINTQFDTIPPDQIIQTNLKNCVSLFKHIPDMSDNSLIPSELPSDSLRVEYISANTKVLNECWMLNVDEWWIGQK